nr:uncharacterized protein CFP56_22204 [Quercus suber]
MAQVLQRSPQPDPQSCYHTTGLRRSHHSSSSLSTDHSTSQSAPLRDRRHPSSASLPTPAESSPRSFTTDFTDPATSCSPSNSGLSFSKNFGADEHIAFSDYDGVNFYNQNEDYSALSYAGESSDEPMESATTDTTRSDSPLPTPVGVDDTAVKQPPSRHVDYLSHDWREEDIWSSWRHIVSQRRVYGQRSRLENASWRTWAKSKYRLATVSPETLNWLKESDVTWLYGPLTLAQSHPITDRDSAPRSPLSKNNSFVSKKPILKKRSMSEVMLQKSLSTTSLLKQAAASVQAQQVVTPSRSQLDLSRTDYTFSATSSETPSRPDVDYFTSHSDSTSESPGDRQEERHIRFDDTVEQCIAVECKEGDFDDEPDDDAVFESTDSDSDEGLIMLKRRKRPGLSRSNTGSGKSSRSSSHGERRTIETLPSTTLKYRTDSPHQPDGASTVNTFDARGTSKLSPSPSQETLRPAHPSKNFLVRDDEDGDVDMESSWSFGATNPKSSLGASSGVEASGSRGRDHGSSSRARCATPGPASQNYDDDYTSQGMRRTSSGMLMPYDEDEDEMMAVGIFGRVSETINTAKDIAHVIWNVGWRKQEASLLREADAMQVTQSTHRLFSGKRGLPLAPSAVTRRSARQHARLDRRDWSVAVSDSCSRLSHLPDSGFSCSTAASAPNFHVIYLSEDLRAQHTYQQRFWNLSMRLTTAGLHIRGSFHPSLDRFTPSVRKP